MVVSGDPLTQVFVGPDPLGLGDATIEPGPPITFDGGTEVEIASAVSRAMDSLSELTKFLPLPEAAAARFRRSMFEAWRQLLTDASICSAEAGSDELEMPDAG